MMIIDEEEKKTFGIGLKSLAFLMIFFSFVSGSHAKSETNMKRTLSLSATGTVSAPSDMMTIRTGIHTLAITAREALSINNDMMQSMIAALKSMGLKSSDIQTVNFSIHPRYNRYKNLKEPKVIGYNVANDIMIQLHDLDKAGEILDRVVTLGVNRINSLTFSVKDKDTLKNDARKKAMANVIAKAKLYAREAGVTLGRILTISENFRASTPPGIRPAMARNMAAPVAVEGGNTAIAAQVSVVWELVD